MCVLSALWWYGVWWLLTGLWIYGLIDITSQVPSKVHSSFNMRQMISNMRTKKNLPFHIRFRAFFSTCLCLFCVCSMGRPYEENVRHRNLMWSILRFEEMTCGISFSFGRVLNANWQVSQSVNVRSDKYYLLANYAPNVDVTSFSKALWPSRKWCVNGKIVRMAQFEKNLFPIRFQ